MRKAVKHLRMILLLLNLYFFSLFNGATPLTRCPNIQYLYQFGASKSDTGNLIRIHPIGPTLPAARLPYGETFPGKPTGRWSDGLLIIDRAAMALGLPLLNPYLQRNASFRNGVNFAVAGSTALDFSFFAARGIQVPSITVPLSDQLNWFRTYLSSNCSTPPECANQLKRALLIVGEVGGNDVSYSLTQGKSIQEIQTYVPFITEAKVNATRELIGLGAAQIVVPGNFPIGCFPFFLSAFSTNDSQAFDDVGCLKELNNLTVFQNSNLQEGLNSLRGEFPNVTILYSDYYAAFLSVLRRAPVLGFEPTTVLKSCCGIGGQYNYDGNRTCGSEGVPVCPYPSRYIHWDGLHLTQEAYRRISDIIINDMSLEN